MKSFAWLLIGFLVYLLVQGRLFDYFKLASSGGENG